MSYSQTFKFHVVQYICKFISLLLSSLYFTYVSLFKVTQKCLCACVFDSVSAPDFFIDLMSTLDKPTLNFVVNCHIL